MHIDKIIELGDAERLKRASDSELYLRTIIILLVCRSLYDYCLVCDECRSTSYTRSGDKDEVLPDPPLHEINHLMSLLTDVWPEPIKAVDFGEFTKACIMNLTGELVLCFFVYSHDGQRGEHYIRLHYGPSAPAAAGRLVPLYRRFLENLGTRAGCFTQLSSALSKLPEPRTGIFTRLLLVLSKMIRIPC